MENMLKEILTNDNLEEDVNEYISKRCSDALLSNEKYIEAEHQEVDSDILTVMAEQICYKQGVKDTLKLIKNLL